MSTTQVPESQVNSTQTQSQVNSQSQETVKFENCLIVTRHKLLSSQEEDIKTVCANISVVPELPNDQQKLKETIQPFDAIIGVLPLPLQIQILQAKKSFVSFIMTSLGTVDNKEDAEKKASQYPGRCAILPPSKEGEKWRVTRYDGLKAIKEIKVIDEWLVKHPS